MGSYLACGGSVFMPQTATRQKTLYVDMVLQIILSISKKLGRKFYRQYQSHAITNFVNTYKMKAKRFEFEAYTITQTAKKLGYKSTKTIYRLLNRKVIEDYVYSVN